MLIIEILLTCLLSVKNHPDDLSEGDCAEDQKEDQTQDVEHEDVPLYEDLRGLLVLRRVVGEVVVDPVEAVQVEPCQDGPGHLEVGLETKHRDEDNIDTVDDEEVEDEGVSILKQGPVGLCCHSLVFTWFLVNIFKWLEVLFDKLLPEVFFLELQKLDPSSSQLLQVLDPVWIAFSPNSSRRRGRSLFLFFLLDVNLFFHFWFILIILTNSIFTIFHEGK